MTELRETILGQEVLSIVRDESWVPEACRIVCKMYGNQGLHPVASLMASVHPWALDYIRQAPVLVLAAGYGANNRLSRKERVFIAQQFGGLVERKTSLRKMMGAYNIAYQLRAIKANAVHPSRWHALQWLSKNIPPSTLAQIIPKTVAKQTNWLRAIAEWNGAWKRRNGEAYPRWDAGRDKISAQYTDWVAHAYTDVSPADVRHIGDIADYITATRATFSDKWTLAQVKEKSERWHKDVAKMTSEAKFLAQHGVGWEDPIKHYDGIPDITTIDGMDVIPLRTGAEIYAEGYLMHHCVSQYTARVITGHSLIFSIRSRETRLATLELIFAANQDRWIIGQCKGPCNREPPMSIRAVSSQFLKMINARKDGK